MKKLFLVLFLLLAFNALAVEVYNNGDNKVDIYGDIRGYVGYGFAFDAKIDEKVNGTSSSGYPTDFTYFHDMAYGISSASNVGTNIKIGQFQSKFELGANEQTIFSRSNSADTIGLRYAWAAWNFQNGSRLLFGKADTLTSMNGFSSDIFNNDGGLYGVGGTSTNHRRFQVQYSIAGFSIAVMEDDRLFESGGEFFPDFSFTDVYIPRVAVSYVYENDSLLAKIAATYSAYEGFYLDSNASNRYAAIHAFGIVGGIKPYFNNKNSWLSFQIRYGMNEDMYGETGYGFLFKGNDIYYAAVLPYVDQTGYIYNMHRVSTTFEYGVKIHDKFTLIAGLGYQADLPSLGIEDESSILTSYAVFLQGQYSITDNFMLVPQIAYLGSIMYGEAKMPSYTLELYEESNAIMAGLQLRVLF